MSEGQGNVFSETLASPSTGIIPLCCQLSLPSSTSKSEISAWQFMAERRTGEGGKYSSHSRGKCDEKDQNRAHTQTHTDRLVHTIHTCQTGQNILGTVWGYRQLLHTSALSLRQKDAQAYIKIPILELKVQCFLKIILCKVVAIFVEP